MRVRVVDVLKNYNGDLINSKLFIFLLEEKNVQNVEVHLV